MPILLPFGSQEMYNAGMMPCFSLSLSLIFPSLSAPCIMVMACVYNISPLYQSFALTLSRYKSRWRVSDWESATSRRATSFYTTQKEAQASCFGWNSYESTSIHTKSGKFPRPAISGILLLSSSPSLSHLCCLLHLTSFVPCCVCSYTITTCIEGKPKSLCSRESFT